ncbi:chitinase 5 [Folsomia candida]|uniref:Chitinase 5 n=1 Tax=Folsomia candida TaxID=158441 RepID=A0A226E0C7_FOLCA|nr:chitinase 5 [Folsomia candida]OXA50750.1 Chitinase 5 [Folsomia candida]
MINITKDEFNSAVTKSGYPKPSEDQYNSFAAELRGNWKLHSKDLLAMFFANVLHESRGLQSKREENPPHDYNTVQAWFQQVDKELQKQYPQNKYFGRGYLQLSWIGNYREASEAIFPNDKLKLVKDPDLIARDESVAWKTAFWFWMKNVNRHVCCFPSSIKRINPTEETKSQIDSRISIYKKVVDAFDVDAIMKKDGCNCLKELKDNAKS